MTNASPLAACLIVEPMPVVAHDLATTLNDTLRRPTLVATSEAQALDLLAGLDPESALHMAIVRMNPELFSNSPLRTMIEARHARVILMGSDPGLLNGDKPWPWAVLEWPFGTGQLVALLVSLGLMSDTEGR